MGSIVNAIFGGKNAGKDAAAQANLFAQQGMDCRWSGVGHQKSKDHQKCTKSQDQQKSDLENERHGFQRMTDEHPDTPSQNEKSDYPFHLIITLPFPGQIFPSGSHLTEEFVLGFPNGCGFASLAHANRNFRYSRLPRPLSS